MGRKKKSAAYSAHCTICVILSIWVKDIDSKIVGSKKNIFNTALNKHLYNPSLMIF